MQMSKRGIIELANYEALAHTKYIDSGGVHTIGIGMTVSEIKDLNQWPWDKELSTKECVHMYVKGLHKYVDAVNKALLVDVKQHQFDALVSICYNIGVGGTAKSTFMRRLNAGESAARVTEAMRWWHKDNGKVVKGLINRRRYESELYEDGVYRCAGPITLIRVNSARKPVYKGTIDIEPFL